MSNFTMVDPNNPSIKYLRGYISSRAILKKLPDTISIVKGMISKVDLDKSLQDTSEININSIWNRAVSIYHNKVKSSYKGKRIVISLFNDDVKQFVDDAKDKAIFVDEAFLNYIATTYHEDGDSMEMGYNLLDKFFLDKVINSYRLDTTYYYMQNILIGILQSPRSYFLQDLMRHDAGDNYLDGYRQEDKLKEFTLAILSVYIDYCYNEAILRGNLEMDRIDPGYRFIQVLENLYISKLGMLRDNLNTLDELAYSVCNIKDPVFLLLIKSILEDDMRYGGFGGATKDMAIRMASNLRTYAKNTNLKNILINNKPVDYIQKKSDERERRWNDGVDDNAFVCMTVESESLHIMKNEVSARDLMRLSFVPNRAVTFYKENVGIQITRTDAEMINNLSRKVDLCSIQFENMSNQWNKEDAFNYAYDILNEIDDAAAKTKNKDTMLAIQAVRNNLTNAMTMARKKDIKKMRTTINISYPKGYGGQ